MKDLLYIPYEKARPLIQEGDVLLVRGNRWFSFFIKKFTQSPYSHVALASWHNGNDKTESILEIVEFRLFIGGASRNLSRVVDKKHKLIDVYRPSPHRCDLEYRPDNGVLINETTYDGKAVTNTMRELTALPYSILKIGLFARGYSFGLRFLSNLNIISDDTLRQSTSHVCSTSVAYSMNANGYDLVKNKADLRTEPGDLSKSPLLNYLFTIE
uniref:Putative peptidase n=1 Tax=viral metagenome TaxID=1070528 RepID=A0A6M3LFB9_9ZZZZ